MFNTRGGSNASQLQGVQINSSDYGMPLPIVYGQNRVSTNVIWFNNFQTSSQSGGGKGESGGKSYSYSAAVMLAICEGPLPGVGINQIYVNRGPLPNPDSHGNTPLQQEDLTFSNGAQNQPIWSYLEANYPTQALPYAGTAWVANSNMSLDSNAGIPNYTFEVCGLLQSANPYSNRGTWSSAATYNPGDFVLDPGNADQPYVCFAQVGPTGNQPHTQAGPSGQAGYYWTTLGSNTPDANPADIIPDVLTNQRYGAGFPAGSIADLSDYRNYCIAAGFFFSPVLDQQEEVQEYLTEWTDLSNSAIVWSQGQIKIIPYGDMPITGNGVTWTPNNTIVYNLTDDDFIAGSEDPIQVDRTSPSDAYNDYKMEWKDRSNNYNSATAEVQDQSAIDLYGIRIASTITAHEICVGSIAQLSLQLTMQRALYLRNVYTFTLPINFCLLEPMDLVTITDSVLGYNQLPVRVTAVEEDDQFNLKITAEDFILGIGTAFAQAVQQGGTQAYTQGADPGTVAAPFIFNMSQYSNANIFGRTNSYVATGDLQIGIATAGLNPNYGGCEIWACLSGGFDLYEKVGTINGSARYGALSAAYGANSDPDTTHTLAVDLTESGGTLTAGTDADADATTTLCIVDTELLSYSTATLTAASKYNLTGYIRRGQLNTPIAAHASGAPFARLDGQIFKLSYNKAQSGKTLLLKLLAFNLLGNNTQALADVSPYSILLGSPQLVPDVVSGLMLTTAWIGTSFALTWNPSDAATGYTVNAYKSDGVTLLRSVITTDTMFSYSLSDATADGDIERTYVVKIIAMGSYGAASPTSITVTKSAPAAETSVTASSRGVTSSTLAWGVNAAPDLAGYQAYYSTTGGFNPASAGTLAYSGTANGATLTGLTTGTTYYLRVAAYDQWSSNRAQLNFSAQVAFTP